MAIHMQDEDVRGILRRLVSLQLEQFVLAVVMKMAELKVTKKHFKQRQSRRDVTNSKKFIRRILNFSQNEIESHRTYSLSTA